MQLDEGNGMMPEPKDVVEGPVGCGIATERIQDSHLRTGKTELEPRIPEDSEVVELHDCGGEMPLDCRCDTYASSQNRVPSEDTSMDSVPSAHHATTPSATRSPPFADGYDDRMEEGPSSRSLPTSPADGRARPQSHSSGHAEEGKSAEVSATPVEDFITVEEGYGENAEGSLEDQPTTPGQMHAPHAQTPQTPQRLTSEASKGEHGADMVVDVAILNALAPAMTSKPLDHNETSTSPEQRGSNEMDLDDIVEEVLLSHGHDNARRNVQDNQADQVRRCVTQCIPNSWVREDVFGGGLVDRHP